MWRVAAAASAFLGLSGCAPKTPQTQAEFQRRLDVIAARCGLAGKIELRALSATEWTAVFGREWTVYSLKGGAGPATRYFNCARQQVRLIPRRNFRQSNEILPSRTGG